MLGNWNPNRSGGCLPTSAEGGYHWWICTYFLRTEVPRPLSLELRCLKKLKIFCTIPFMPKRKHSMSAMDLSKISRSVGDQDPTQTLTEMQQVFVNAVARDNINKVAAARQAGFKSPHVASNTLMTNTKIQAAIAKERAITAEVTGMTKQKVIDGFTESIDMARMKGEPVAMIMGWREIGKMCGFYEPQKTEVRVSFKGQMVLQRINTMSDEELLALVDDAPSILEGEYNDEPHQALSTESPST